MTKESKDEEIYIYIDPPSGWRYGFPKKIKLSERGNLREILLKSGYPKEDIELAILYMRSWSNK